MAMKFGAALLGVLLALPLTGAAGPPPLAQEKRDAVREFLKTSGRGATLAMDRTTGTASFMHAGVKPLASGADRAAREHAAKRFLQRQATLFGLSDPASELMLAESRSDERAQHHYLFQQHVNGVPVHGATLRAHFNAAGELHAVMARTVTISGHIDTTPALSTDAALEIVRAQFTRTDQVNATPRLEVRAFDDRWRLTYAIETMVDGINRWQTIVDANSGEVLRHHLDHHETATAATGTGLDGSAHAFSAWHERQRYHMMDTTMSGYLAQPSLHDYARKGVTYVVDYLGTIGDDRRIVSSASANAGWDAAAVSALVHGQAALRYFRDTHGRHGIDGDNASLLVGIHYDEAYDNAFWNGKWVILGDGRRKFSNLAACLDIVGHELTHGVIQHTANLKYENQSGALNESLADVFGVLIEGRNWTVAEDCTIVQPGYLRDMANPERGRKAQPRHMSEYVQRENTKEGDWGGVHTNSGIPNRAAYLLIEGLSVEGMGTSIGRARAEQLYYRALSTYLLSSSQFIDMRRALLLAAADLYPNDREVQTAIRAAFDAVGIVEDDMQTLTKGTLAFESERLDFGDVSLGESKHLSLKLVNSTAAAAQVRDVHVSGSAFSVNFPVASIGAGESLQLSVSFAADYAGPASALLSVRLEDGSLLDVQLTGNAVLEAETAAGASGGGSGASLLLLLFALSTTARRRTHG